jgi:hypothetical protein
VGLVQLVDQRALVVRLEAVHLGAVLGTVGHYHGLDGSQGVRPVDGRVAHTEHIQVRPVHK